MPPPSLLRKGNIKLESLWVQGFGVWTVFCWSFCCLFLLLSFILSHNVISEALFSFYFLFFWEAALLVYLSPFILLF